MNITELASQIYNYAATVPINNRYKRKTKKYLRALTVIKSEFLHQEFNHSCVYELTSLMTAFEHNVYNMKLYGNDAAYRKAITENTFELEKAIIKSIDRCYKVLEKNTKLVRRHTI